MNPILLALDTTDKAQAKVWVDDLHDLVGGFKIGLEFFCRHGSDGVSEVVGEHPLFLDLKFLDIPNTVSGAIRAIRHLRPRFITVHTISKDETMLRAAVAAAHQNENDGFGKTHVLGVTVLTSVKATQNRVIALAKFAQRCGLDGVICGGMEARSIRKGCGEEFIIICPGIRLDGESTDDQQRVMTPAKALRFGANYIVVGRPITLSTNPRQTVKGFLPT